MDKRCNYISVTFKYKVFIPPICLSASILERDTAPRLSDLSPWSPENRGSDKEENQDETLSQ